MFYIIRKIADVKNIIIRTSKLQWLVNSFILYNEFSFKTNVSGDLTICL